MTATLSGTWSIIIITIIITVTFSASFADDNLNWMSVFTAQTGGWVGWIEEEYKILLL